MKKNLTTYLLLAAAAAGAYYFIKKKSPSATEKELQTGSEDDTTGSGSETTKTDAVVTAPAGKFQAALDTAKEITNNIKDVAVLVKSGNKTALVRHGTKRKKPVKCPKLTKKQLDTICEGLEGSELKKCRKKNKRSCITVQPTESSLTPFNDTADNK
jgi:hypothetical protein